jgi:enoyl reductase-like protein
MSQFPNITYNAVFQHQAELLRTEYNKDQEYMKKICTENTKKTGYSKIKPMTYVQWLEERLIKLELGCGEYSEEGSDE